MVNKERARSTGWKPPGEEGQTNHLPTEINERNWNTIGSGSASKYKSRLDNRYNKLSFYQSSPPLEVCLKDFELFAVDCLRVLKGLEDALSRGKNRKKWKAW